MSDLTPQQQTAYILFTHGFADMKRAAAIDPKYAEFMAKVKEIHAEYADQLRP